MLFVLILMLSLAYGQDIEGCAGSPADPTCDGIKDVGNADEEGCDDNANALMWYFSETSCNKMAYLGCGGNRNRYCSQFVCELFCERWFKTGSGKWEEKSS